MSGCLLDREVTLEDLISFIGDCFELWRTILVQNSVVNFTDVYFKSISKFIDFLATLRVVKCRSLISNIILKNEHLSSVLAGFK